ncbi:MAG: pilus assembly PilX family protein [Stenotrophobium sp.]
MTTRSLTHTPSRQSGIALIVSLVLLVVVTLLGLAAIRGTTIWQKITGNFYDREMAFQAAEAALYAAEQNINNPGQIARTCGAGGQVCEANPFTDSTLTYQTVSIGTASGSFTTGTNSSWQPQYVIEDMGLWTDPNTGTGFNQTANGAQYGAQGVQGNQSKFYRITSRSGDPSVIGDRAVVTLQAMYKQ